MISDRVITIISLIIIVSAIGGWSANLVKALPYTSDEIEEICSDGKDHEYSVIWAIPTNDLPIVGIDTVSVTYKDFHESMSKLKLRYDCEVASVYEFINPEDKYVQKIAEYIESLDICTDDMMKASIGLAYVQCAIEYTSDEDLFDMPDFALYPTETLYLGKGDCEDTSILLCSIYRAMGLESTLAKYPSHVAVLVTIGNTVYKAETTNHTVLTTNLLDGGHEPRTCTPIPKIASIYAEISCWVRNGIHQILGI